MKNIITKIIIAIFILNLPILAINYDNYKDKPDEWFKSDQAKILATNIISWQDPYGSWPKNLDTSAEPFNGNIEELEGTFDNAATTGEMYFLAHIYRVTNDDSYLKSFNKALDVIFLSQYPTGGWPQHYPTGKHYHKHITFNDGAMVRLMFLLKDITQSNDFRFLSSEQIASAQQAFDKGIKCILNCQIKVDGKLTAWCAQHDEITLEPRPARAFEPASISGGESAGIVELLTSLKHPDRKVALAIKAAVEWYKKSAIENLGLSRDDNGDEITIDDPEATTCWARFYEIDTNRPIFLGRDSVIHYNFNEIEAERRNGYAWYGDWGEKVFSCYDNWKKSFEYLTYDPNKKLIWVIGDSTVCNYPENSNRAGWGQLLENYFDTNKARIFNLARSGRSTKTFIKEGLWQSTLDAKPNYILIQFGHNDSHDPKNPESTDSKTDYKDYLRRYITEARNINAFPILVTPMHRRTFNENGTLNDNLKPYADAMKDIANEMNVPLIDLHTSSGKLFAEMGPEESQTLANKYSDRTHFNKPGAQKMLELITPELFNKVSELNKLKK